MNTHKTVGFKLWNCNVEKSNDRRKSMVDGGDFKFRRGEYAYNFLGFKEKFDTLARILIKEFGYENFTSKRALDVGCGRGSHLVNFLALGFPMSNLVGCDLSEDRIARISKSFSNGIRVFHGDFLDMQVPSDVVLFMEVLSCMGIENRFSCGRESLSVFK
jgi:SAM-dependent methyltransferase